MCGNYEYSDLAPRDEFNLLVEEKLKLNLEKLELMAEEKVSYVSSIRYQLDGVSCEQADVDEHLSDLYDDYDIEKFNLEMFEPISTPLITQREAAYKNQLALKKYLEVHAKEAESIVIAYLIPLQDASSEYIEKNVTSSIYSKYIYEISEGWKKPLNNQYFLPPFSTSMSLEAGSYKGLIESKKKIKEILFIKQERSNILINVVIGSINLDLYPADLSFLNEPEWHWVNYQLVKQKMNNSGQ